MVGHSTLRVAAMNTVDRPATADEIEIMRASVVEAMQAGAIGLSSGLFYPTSKSAPAEEVTTLLRTVAAFGGIYATHMRDEGDAIDDALTETFRTAREADVPLIISHHKCMGKANFGRSAATLARIQAESCSHPIAIDVYPYEAGSSMLLPELLRQAGRVRLSWSAPFPEMAGRDIADIAKFWDVSGEVAMDRLKPGGAIYYMMDQADVERILVYPDAMIGSDGLPHDRFPHPRLWGTFARVLGPYTRDLQLFTLEEAVRKMTGLTAARFGLAGRGVIEVGAFADLVLFDADNIGDRATYDDPTLPSAGILHVVVNGVPVLGPCSVVGSRPGHILRRTPSANLERTPA